MAKFRFVRPPSGGRKKSRAPSLEGGDRAPEASSIADRSSDPAVDDVAADSSLHSDPVAPHQALDPIQSELLESSVTDLLSPESPESRVDPSGPSFDDDATPDGEEPRFLNMLSERARCLLFSYSPKLKSLVAWSSNAPEVLGVSDKDIVREGNLFLRHVHPEDRFRVLSALEQALRGECRYEITYRWIRPDKDELRWIHCRASLNTISPRDPAGGATAQTFSALGLQSDQLLLEGIMMDVTQSDVVHLAEPKEGSFSERSLSVLPSLAFLIDHDLRLKFVSSPTSQGTAPDEPKSMRRSLERQKSKTPTPSLGIAIEAFDFGDSQFSIRDFAPGRLVLQAFGTETLRHHYARIFEQLLSGALPSFHTRLRHVDPPLSLDLYPWLSGDTIVGIFGLVGNASELAKLERQLSDLRRAEGLRSLASGVSHHVNNVLQAIIGQATVIRERPHDRELVARSAASIGELVTRASELTQQLFLFDESPQGALQPVDLNLSVMAAVSAAEELFSSPLELQVSFGNPSAVLAKQQPLVDAIRELLRTARDHVAAHSVATRHVTPLSRSAPVAAGSAGLSDLATESAPLKVGASLPEGTNEAESSSTSGAQKDAGPQAIAHDSQLSIRTYQAEIQAHEVPSTRPGHYAHLVIAETKRLTAPLEAPLRRMRSLHSVTSSSSFRRAQTIVERFGGTITAQLPPDGGFSIALILPAMVADEGHLLAVEPGAAPEILLVDDDGLVLQTVDAMLQNAGYLCVTAQSSQRANVVAKAFRETLRVALVDAVMPGEDEQALIRQLKETIPELIVIGFTGAAQEKGDALKAAGAERILRKPVDPMVLRDTMRSLLGPSDKAANS